MRQSVFSVACGKSISFSIVEKCNNQIQNGARTHRTQLSRWLQCDKNIRMKKKNEYSSMHAHQNRVFICIEDLGFVLIRLIESQTLEITSAITIVIGFNRSITL